MSRDGVAVGLVALSHDATSAVVAPNLAAAPASAGLHRLDTIQAAEAFVGDLIDSFAYLGCDVAAT